MWQEVASSWNGVAFFLDPTWTPASELQLYTDASGTLGFGGYWNGAWFSQPWPPHLAAKPIKWKELYAMWSLGLSLVSEMNFVSLWQPCHCSCLGVRVVSLFRPYIPRAELSSLWLQVITLILIRHVLGTNNWCSISTAAASCPCTSPRGQPLPNTHPCQPDGLLTRQLHRLQARGVAHSTWRTYQVGISTILQAF